MVGEVCKLAKGIGGCSLVWETQDRFVALSITPTLGGAQPDIVAIQVDIGTPDFKELLGLRAYDPVKHRALFSDLDELLLRVGTDTSPDDAPKRPDADPAPAEGIPLTQVIAASAVCLLIGLAAGYMVGRRRRSSSDPNTP